MDPHGYAVPLARSAYSTKEPSGHGPEHPAATNDSPWRDLISAKCWIVPFGCQDKRSSTPQLRPINFAAINWPSTVGPPAPIGHQQKYASQHQDHTQYCPDKRAEGQADDTEPSAEKDHTERANDPHHQSPPVISYSQAHIVSTTILGRVLILCAFDVRHAPVSGAKADRVKVKRPKAQRGISVP
jgi:hypothetical protein